MPSDCEMNNLPLDLFRGSLFLSKLCYAEMMRRGGQEIYLGNILDIPRLQ